MDRAEALDRLGGPPFVAEGWPGRRYFSGWGGGDDLVRVTVRHEPEASRRNGTPSLEVGTVTGQVASGLKGHYGMVLVRLLEEVTLPVTFRVDAWDGDVRVEGTSVPCRFVGQEEQWVGELVAGGRTVQLVARGVDWRSLRLVAGRDVDPPPGDG